MVDYSKPPICQGPCIRCNAITGGLRWFCDVCLSPMRIVDRTPKPRPVVRLHRSTAYQQMRKTA